MKYDHTIFTRNLKSHRSVSEALKDADYASPLTVYTGGSEGHLGLQMGILCFVAVLSITLVAAFVLTK